MLVGAEPAGPHAATVPDPGGEVAHAWGARRRAVRRTPDGLLMARGRAGDVLRRVAAGGVASPSRPQSPDAADPRVTLRVGEARREAAGSRCRRASTGARRRPGAVPGPRRPAARRPGRPRPGSRVRRGLRPLTSPRRTRWLSTVPVGDVPHKRHTGTESRRDPVLRGADGREGFSSDSSLLYHVNIPSAVVDVRPWELPDLTNTHEHPLTPALLHPRAVPGRRLGRPGRRGHRAAPADGQRRRAAVGRRRHRADPLLRNAIGDECLYIEAGRAVVETVFGDLAVGEGDYAIVPRATTFRVVEDPCGST